jgi:hypothetical protein|tara:strand:- start:7426 stop:8262 length:837 start_codon:yes stop_codon:yes gene_type:complete
MKLDFLKLFLIVFIIQDVSAVIISEVMYNPIQSEYYNEWIEIYNNGSEVDLSNWTLCGKTLLAGYIDYADGQLKSDTTMILSAGNYAIITDGDSGTEVYSNFAVADSLSLYVNSASLCTGLKNDGDSISLEDAEGILINSMTYDGSWGASNDGNSLQFGEEWCADSPTPGSINDCSIPEIQNETEQEIITEENASEIDKNNILEPVQTSFVYEDKQEEIINQKIENSIIRLTPKTIKSEENIETSDKNNYAIYGFVVFCILLVFLFLLKRKKFKNEFN